AICGQSQALAETLVDSDRQPRPTLVRQYNKRHARDWDTIRKFLCIHYKFNTRLDTPFWQACRADAELGDAVEIVDYYKENGPSVAWRKVLLQPGDQFDMEGYLSLLLGQQVPYKKTYVPSERDLAAWDNIRQNVYHRVSRAYNTAEALQMIRSPGWVWPQGLF